MISRRTRSSGLSMLFSAAIMAVAVVPLTAGLPSAAAAEGVRYPAAMCRQHAGPGIFVYFSSVVAPGLPAKSEPRHVSGGICPPPQGGGCPPCESTSCGSDPAFSAKLDCPIPKSFPDNGTRDVTVDVIDRHASLNVECFLTSVVWNAGANDFVQNSKRLETSGAGNNIQPLKFTAHSAAGPAAHWYVACTLPPNSAIVSYFVEEN